ncbi:MAG: prepilin-type N-terminal cleavage/methylation domain-containing protein [Synergistales bacterium]|nr:prepilin-type N-terminal cleavage/methylation domain-containing protein [Synergistales bacterium]
MTNSKKTGSKRRKAFTLVEVLIALLITSVIGGSAVSLLYTYLKNYEQSSEYTTALQRGQMVLSILQPVVLNGALSIPWGDEFADLAPQLGVPSMKEPLEVHDRGSMKSGDLSVFYVLPSNIGSSVAIDDISANFSVPLFPTGYTLGDLKSFLSSAYMTPGDTVERWVLFPSAQIPLKSSQVPTDMSVTFNGSPGAIGGKISQGDRMFILRHLRAYVGLQPGQSIPSLFISDNGNGAMPQVLGIRRVFFEWDTSTHNLRVWILSQGDGLFPSPISQDVEWPSSSGYTLTSDDFRFYLAVSTADWRVRN